MTRTKDEILKNVRTDEATVGYTALEKATLEVAIDIRDALLALVAGQQEVVDHYSPKTE